MLAAFGLGSRAQIQRWIDDGCVAVGARTVQKASLRVDAGTTIRVVVPEATPLDVLPEAIALDILYEDADVIAINKRAGMVVHPSLGHQSGTLVNALLHHCHDLAGIGGVLRPGIVHRLDKDTTGVMIVAKHDGAHQALTELFARREGLVREYIALTSPGPVADSLTLDTNYGRHPTERKLFSSKGQGGKRAITHVRVLARAGQAALIACRLQTGRTHQIRVHCADHGFPIVGDPTYGRMRWPAAADAGSTLGRQALHARSLELPHPCRPERLMLAAPPPDDFLQAAARLQLAV